MTAGLSALGSSRIVVIGGLAELFSGAISMGVGGYFSTKAERDNYNYLRRQTEKKLEEPFTNNLQEEIFDIFGPHGLDRTTAERIADSLKAADSKESNAGEGLISFILKFGEGFEPVSSARVYGSAITIALSYLIGGLIPMVSTIRDPS